MGGEQAVEIVKEGEIADYQHGRLSLMSACFLFGWHGLMRARFLFDWLDLVRSGADTQRAGDDAVDAVASPIADATHSSLAAPEEGIHVTHGHTIADVERGVFGQQFVEFGEDTPLEWLREVLDGSIERLPRYLIGPLPQQKPFSLVGNGRGNSHDESGSYRLPCSRHRLVFSGRGHPLRLPCRAINRTR